MWDPYADFKKITLPNGLDIYSAQWPRRSFEVVEFVIHSGSELDDIGMEGLAHFVEHLVSNNTIIEKEKIKDFFEESGGYAQLGGTNYSGTSYSFFSPLEKNFISKAFSIFGEMLFNAKLEKRIEEERKIILNEFNRAFPTKMEFNERIIRNKAVFSGYWLERFASPLGSLESISAIDKKSLQNFYDNYYTPLNMSIIAVGGFNIDELKDLIFQSVLGKYKKGERCLNPIPLEAVNLPKENLRIIKASEVISEKIPVEAAQYESACLIPRTINDFVLRIFKRMLNKILLKEIREKRNWVYGINGTYFNFRHFYEFLIRCNHVDLKAIDEIDNVVFNCLMSLKDNLELFNKEKNNLLRMTNMIDYSASDLCSDVSDDLRIFQKVITLSEDINNIKAVSINDINNLLQFFSNNRRYVTLLKP